MVDDETQGLTIIAGYDGSDAVGFLDGSGRGSVQARTMTGEPGVVLVDLAVEVGADLLVVGRRGGDFVARMLLGSIAERVVQHARCDVLVVA